MEKNTQQQELLIKMILAAWETQNNTLNKFLDDYPDDQLSKEIAPGKNTGIYLLGHLIAVSDGMLPLLGFGERLFPHLDPIFVHNADHSGLEQPSIADLKAYLHVVNAKLAAFIQSTSITGWLERHTAISPEDFEKEPHRNKLNIFINRTNHMAYHLGQLVLLK